MKKIDGFSIGDLVKKFGSPLFIVSGAAVKNNYRAFRAAFSGSYPEVRIAYSYKVNYIPAILEIIHGEGAWAEVASGFEYDLARKLGVPGRSIVFNGPHKKKEELSKALSEGALINADHLDEIKLLEKIAREEGRPVDIGIRVNMNVGIEQFPDRFGFNLESGEAAQIIKRSLRKRLIRIIGLHVHLTSYIVKPYGKGDSPAKSIKLIWPKDSRAYRRAAKKIAGFSKEIKEGFGIDMKYLDMGGGFPAVDSLSPYVAAVTEPILKGFGNEDLPSLILEPGRAIVSRAVHLVTTVVAAKELTGGNSAVIVDSGINLLPTSFWKFQEIECLTKSGKDLKETTVYGPLCLQTDIIGRCLLPGLRAGDRLLIKNVGAYNIPQSSSFIFPLPPILLIDDGRLRLVRRAETVEDVLSA